MKLNSLVAALPIALDNLGDVLARLEKEELPRIDKVLDNVPATVQNMNAILNTVHTEDQPRVEAIMDEVPAGFRPSHHRRCRRPATRPGVQNPST